MFTALSSSLFFLVAPKTTVLPNQKILNIRNYLFSPQHPQTSNNASSLVALQFKTVEKHEPTWYTLWYVVRNPVFTREARHWLSCFPFHRYSSGSHLTIEKPMTYNSFFSLTSREPELPSNSCLKHIFLQERMLRPSNCSKIACHLLALQRYSKHCTHIGEQYVATRRL